ISCMASSADGINWTQGVTLGPGGVPGLVKTASGQLFVYVVYIPSTATGGVTLVLTPASGTQLTNFTITGSNYTPNGEIYRYVQFPGQSFTQISSTTAAGDGTLSFS